MTDLKVKLVLQQVALKIKVGGSQGIPGAKGDQGDPGIGLPPGGTTGQVPKKASNADYDIVWSSGGGGGGGSVESVNGQLPDGSGNVTLTKTNIGLSNVDNTSDANKPVSTAQAAADAAVQAFAVQRANHSGTQLAATISDFSTAADARITVQKGAANGLATLDATSKVPMSQIPAALLGAANYQSAWNASTNSPALVSSTGTKGFYYVVSVPGSTNLDGEADWKLGDWAIFNGSVYQKVDNTDAVISVNGKIGAVVLNTDDIAESGSPTNQWFTAARVRATVLTGLSTATNAAITAADSVLIAFGKLQAQISLLRASGINMNYTTPGATIGNGTYVMLSSARRAGTINGWKNIKSGSGTGTVAVQVNGVNVTGLSAISVTNVAQNPTASGANTYVIGDRITAVVSGASSLIDLEGVLDITN